MAFLLCLSSITSSIGAAHSCLRRLPFLGGSPAHSAALPPLSRADPATPCLEAQQHLEGRTRTHRRLGERSDCFTCTLLSLQVQYNPDSRGPHFRVFGTFGVAFKGAVWSLKTIRREFPGSESKELQHPALRSASCFRSDCEGVMEESQAAELQTL